MKWKWNRDFNFFLNRVTPVLSYILAWKNTELWPIGVWTTLAAPVQLLLSRTMSTHISSFSQYFESPNSYSDSNSRNLPAIIDIVHFLIWSEKLIRWGLCKNYCIENMFILNKIILYWVTKFQKNNLLSIQNITF